MKEIVIVSGKGGVGKSSVTAALGAILSEQYRVLMTDTDVDAPNLHLVLGARLLESQEVETSEKAFIDYERCSDCMTCVDVCRFAAILAGEEPIILPYLCEGCGACAISCPVGAMEIRSVVSGRINILEAGDLLLVGGELLVGAASSGRLVDMVKKSAKKEAESRRAEILLTDGPPGIGCPVIAALKGADYAVLLTEPTPAALSDLQRIIQVTEHFRIPVGIVINKAGLDTGTRTAIRSFAERKGFPVLAEIPYDHSVAMAIAEGRPVVDAYPSSPASRAIARLAETMTARLWKPQ